MIRIVFENKKRILNEIKMEQVLPRFESAAFKKKCDEIREKATSQFARDFVTDAESVRLRRDKEDIARSTMNFQYSNEVLVRQLRGIIPTDISERNKPEALNWVISIFLSGVIKHEIPIIPSSFRTTIETFYQIKEQGLSRILRKSDIYSIKSLTEFIDIVRDAHPAYEKHKQEKTNKDAAAGTNKIYEDENWEVYIPENKGAACKLGKGTSWCTAAPGLDYYEKYHSKEFPLIIFISKNNPEEKYQFWYDSEESQFMDRNDDPINNTELFFKLNEIVKSLANKLPEEVIRLASKYIFKDLGEGYVYVQHGGTERWLLHGQPHRVEGPAIIRSSGVGVNEYYLNGQLHNENGPARTYSASVIRAHNLSSDSEPYYLYGHFYGQGEEGRKKWEEVKLMNQRKEIRELSESRKRPIRIIFNKGKNGQLI